MSQIIAIAEIAHRGNTRRERALGGKTHPQQQHRVRVRAHLCDRISTGVEAEVHVRVDQARQQCDVAEVHNFHLTWRLIGTGVHGTNAAILHHYEHVFQRTGAVKCPCGADSLPHRRSKVYCQWWWPGACSTSSSVSTSKPECSCSKSLEFT